MKQIAISKRFAFLAGSALAACSNGTIALPEHSVERSSLAPKEGERVQIKVTRDISKDECSALIERYRAEGAPDGQISVRKPSKKLKGMAAPWCVENFDNSSVVFNDSLF
jgi:hypothetical protein